MEREVKYDLAILRLFQQMDLPLAKKKLGNEKELFAVINKFMDKSGEMIKTYGEDNIVKDFKDFFDDAEELLEILNKLCISTLIWDTTKLVDALKAADKELIAEKLGVFRLSVENAHGKILSAELDSEENLRNELMFSKEELEFAEAELKIQNDDNDPVPIPDDYLEKLDELINKLLLDEANQYARFLLSCNYNYRINEALKMITVQLEKFDFDAAAQLSGKLKKIAASINESIEKNITKPVILAVDDIPDMLQTVKGILSEDYKVCAVTNHVSALKFLDTKNADLIILDIDLGDIDGFTLLKLIRGKEKYRNTPVMFLTANVSKKYILRAIDAGISDYLKKPINAEALLTRVKKYL